MISTLPCSGNTSVRQTQTADLQTDELTGKRGKPVVGSRGGGVLPYMGNIGAGRGIGYGF